MTLLRAIFDVGEDTRETVGGSFGDELCCIERYGIESFGKTLSIAKNILS